MIVIQVISKIFQIRILTNAKMPHERFNVMNPLLSIFNEVSAFECLRVLNLFVAKVQGKFNTRLVIHISIPDA
ncbi:hypothetical protein SAMN02745977_02518 [Brachymonas denitrificans DSM 15123]|uniref:Uncharacterized protein n=1 Tax=Brachymonas denitrificans DSM 15123 TaxID=1121117 RepID=A0A1H8KYU3_9BURK|nr:hypothetical protein SAMN02745977_02518 [Brachymonas denitrificans DSM 15123]